MDELVSLAVEIENAGFIFDNIRISLKQLMLYFVSQKLCFLLEGPPHMSVDQ